MSGPEGARATTDPAASLIQALTTLADLIDPETPGAEEIAGGRATLAWILAALRSLNHRSPDAFATLPLASLHAMQRAMLADAEAEGEA